MQPTLQDLAAQIKDLTHKVESAFVKDEQGDPDYLSHRLFHKKEIESDIEFDKTRNKIIRDVLAWLVVGALSIIAGLLAKTYLLNPIH